MLLVVGVFTQTIQRESLWRKRDFRIIEYEPFRMSGSYYYIVRLGICGFRVFFYYLLRKYLKIKFENNDGKEYNKNILLITRGL